MVMGVRTPSAYMRDIEERIIKMMKEGNLRVTVGDMLEHFTVSERTMGRLFERLRDGKPKRLYICEWAPRNPGGFKPVYAVGDLPDVKRPPKKTPEEIAETNRICNKNWRRKVALEAEAAKRPPAPIDSVLRVWVGRSTR